ncbi:MAG: hypothetical protein WC465_04815 [Patescibacteria group bacterium]
MKTLIEKIKLDQGLACIPKMKNNGILIVGYGYNLVENPAEMNKKEVDRIRRSHIGVDRAEEILTDSLIKYSVDLGCELPFIKKLNNVRKFALLRMVYDLGSVEQFLQFDQMTAKLCSRDFQLASDYILITGWARQSPEIAKEVVQQILTGTIE